MAKDFKPHLFVNNVHTSQKYKVTPRKMEARNTIPDRNRLQHGVAVLGQLNGVWNASDQESAQRKSKRLPVKDGEYISFISAEKSNLKIESLDSSGAQLLNVKVDSDSSSEMVTLFIPADKKDKLISKIEKYTDVKNIERFNEELVARIEQVLKAEVENLWSSSMEYLPKEEVVWVEMWLNGGEDVYEEIKQEFHSICELFNIQIGMGLLAFPERTVLTVKANYTQLEELIKSFGHIAEIRKPEELNSFWLNQTTVEREDWIDETLDKITFNKTDNFISVLDTGVNNGHRLIAPVLADENKLSVNVNWGTNDVGV